MTFYRIVAKDDESKGGIKFPEHVFYRVLQKKGLLFIVIFRPHWNMERKSSTEKERFFFTFSPDEKVLCLGGWLWSFYTTNLLQICREMQLK